MSTTKTVKKQIMELKKLRDDSLDTYTEVFGPMRKNKYDKTEFCFSEEKRGAGISDSIYFRHHVGMDGSSVHRAFSPGLRRYIAKAIEEQKVRLFYRALELIEEDMQSKIKDLKLERDEISELIRKLEGKQLW